MMRNQRPIAAIAPGGWAGVLAVGAMLGAAACGGGGGADTAGGGSIDTAGGLGDTGAGAGADAAGGEGGGSEPAEPDGPYLNGKEVGALMDVLIDAASDRGRWVTKQTVNIAQAARITIPASVLEDRELDQDLPNGALAELTLDDGVDVDGDGSPDAVALFRQADATRDVKFAYWAIGDLCYLIYEEVELGDGVAYFAWDDCDNAGTRDVIVCVHGQDSISGECRVCDKRGCKGCAVDGEQSFCALKPTALDPDTAPGECSSKCLLDDGAKCCKACACQGDTLCFPACGEDASWDCELQCCVDAEGACL